MYIIYKIAMHQSQHYSKYDTVLKVGYSVFTESMLRRRLSMLFKLMGLPQQGLTYHCLRRSGASLAFNNNVSMDSIKNHGAWASDAVWQYLFANSHRTQEVPLMFQQIEHSLLKP